MTTRRQHRVNALIYESLAMIVPGRVSDPRLVDVLITRVETTQDMATAKVYFTCGDGDDAEVAAALEALRHGEGFLRAEIADLGLRRLPHLVFARDRQHESGERVLRLLEQLRASGGTDAAAPPDDAPPEDDDAAHGADRPGGADDAGHETGRARA